MKYSIIGIGFVLLLFSCGSNKQVSTEETAVQDSLNIPVFMEDSAYAAIQTQCGFGPRVMESTAHELCGKYIQKAFEQRGCKVVCQSTTFTRYDGKKFKGYNIIASTHPDAQQRIVICTHWDSRPWCDQDADSTQWHQPVMAANDGASGVGVMLELARLLQKDSIKIGVDFVCFDAEDMGTPDWIKTNENDEDTWCLGAQYWAKNPHAKNINYAILLDMVGGMGACFYKEQFSQQYASNIVGKVWNDAKKAGYGEYFIDAEGGYITDDHLPMNRITHIPTIDIIPYYTDSENVFGPTWHTSHDTVENISKETLKAIGQTLTYLLYTE